MLKQGDNAPKFELKDQDGKVHKLSDYKGKKIVLYFYPRDDTPGCTIESCEFRDSYKEIQKKGAVILGVSNDDEKSHKKFKDKYKLPFDLLADTEKKLVEEFGVFGEKSFMGKKFMGIFRTTFIIDEKGKIKKVFEDVTPKGHSEEIIKEL